MRFLPTILLTAMTGTALAFVGPQTTPNPQTDPQNKPATDRPAATASARGSDTLLATWLLAGNENEIALAELAQQKATNPEVKQFAQKMIDDHRQMSTKLTAFASPSGRSGVGGTQPPGEARAKERPTDTDPAGRTTGAGGTGAMGSVDAIALVQELGDECLSSARKELESKQGAEFDRCYAGMAIGAHMKANDMLTVFQRHASPELKTVLADGQKTVKMHLDHAKQLAKKLEGGTASGTGEKK